MQNKEILDVNNLTITLGGNSIIENLNFTVKKKEVLVVLGPNGAGKTTLLRALLGLVPYDGTITWAENLVRRYLPPQELINRKTLFPLSVLEFLRFKKKSDAQIKEIVHDVGLNASVLTRQIEQLSTGQFQRLLIAWALINKPDILLFDEPTSGIDIGGEETVYSLLHRFWEKYNLTIILVTHHMHVLWEHATNVLCINKKLLCQGAPEKIMTEEMIKNIYGPGAQKYGHRHDL